MEGDTPMTATAEEQNEQTMVKGIRQLLSAVHTLHHSSSSDSSVKEIMEHLESVDVNFHRYCVCVHVHAYMCACVRACMCAYMCACVRACMRAYFVYVYMCICGFKRKNKPMYRVIFMVPLMIECVTALLELYSA